MARATVYGKVLNALTEEPIAGATVAIAENYFLEIFERTQTDTDGYYEFSDLKVRSTCGSYTIATGKDGYAPYSADKPAVKRITLCPDDEKQIDLYLAPTTEATNSLIMGGWDQTIGGEEPCDAYIYDTFFTSLVRQYYEKWSDKTEEVVMPECNPLYSCKEDCRPKHPDIPIITEHEFLQKIANPNVKLFAIHAHGSAEYAGQFEVGEAAAIMATRPALSLVISVSCGFMSSPDSPSSLSYQLRRGQTENTFVIGATDTHIYNVYLFAQEFLKRIDENRNEKFKDAFNAVNKWDNVIWRGDGNLTLNKILKVYPVEIPWDKRIDVTVEIKNRGNTTFSAWSIDGMFFFAEKGLLSDSTGDIEADKNTWITESEIYGEFYFLKSTLEPGETTSVSLTDLGVEPIEASLWEEGTILDVAVIVGYRTSNDSPITWIDELKIDDAIKIV